MSRTANKERPKELRKAILQYLIAHNIKLPFASGCGSVADPSQVIAPFARVFCGHIHFAFFAKWNWRE